MTAMTDVRQPEPARKKRAMPCGAAVCLNCHGGCGAKTAAYTLDGLEFDDGDNCTAGKTRA